MSQEEVDWGVCAISAAVRQGRRTVAALTIPSPITRTPPEVREVRVAQVRAAAREISAAMDAEL